MSSSVEVIPYTPFFYSSDTLTACHNPDVESHHQNGSTPLPVPSGNNSLRKNVSVSLCYLISALNFLFNENRAKSSKTGISTEVLN